MSVSQQRVIQGQRKIYVASSWRNLLQPGVVTAFRKMGHEVYDFRNPAADDNGFHWSEIDGGWESWTGEQYLKALEHPIAEAGFGSDFEAMKWADTFVLVQPCGRSAHLELGWACGAGKTTVMILEPEGFEPELMVKMCDHVCVGLGQALELFEFRNTECAPTEAINIVERCNHLAGELHIALGWVFEPDEKFYDHAGRPRLRRAWDLAMIAFACIEHTDVEDCLAEVRDWKSRNVQPAQETSK